MKRHLIKQIKSSIKLFFSKISEMLEADNGHNKTKWSTTRFTMVTTVLCSNIITWGGVLLLIIIKGVLPDIPMSLVTLYALSNGIVITGKVQQKKHEKIEQIDKISEK